MLSEKRLNEINLKRRNAGLLPLSMFEARRSLQRSNVSEDEDDPFLNAVLLNIVMSELIPNQVTSDDDLRPSDVSCDPAPDSTDSGLYNGNTDCAPSDDGGSVLSNDATINSGGSEFDSSSSDFSSSDF